jgi:seryl-tRNA synthetase
MLDMKWIRENEDDFRMGLAKRGINDHTLLALDADRRKNQHTVDSLKAKQNEQSKLMAASGQPPEQMAALRANLKELASQIKALETQLKQSEEELQSLLLSLPNLPHATVPEGKSENDNQVIKTWGSPRSFSFEPRDHVTLGEQLGWLDFERAAKVSGARFAVYKGHGAALERALLSFMLDVHIHQHGYTEVLAPYLVNAASALGTGQLPKFEADLFKTTDNYYLIPTAEVSVTNLHRDEILAEADLPIRYTSFSPCFRSEAGSYGKDIKGLIRMHQFHKVELVAFSSPEKSDSAHEELTRHAETILELLELPYQRVLLCSGDMGFSATKTYDLEVWLPSQNRYREISSCSNFGEFQARRSQIRYKDKLGKNRFVHTLNGSGLAVGRTWVALVENYQNADGSITVPKALVPYMRGLTRLDPHNAAQS